MSTSLPEISYSPPRRTLSPLSVSSHGGSRPLTPSPAYHVAGKSSPPPRIVRRKASRRALHHAHLDSSESVPSAHGSLYDASVQDSSVDDVAAGRSWDLPPWSSAAAGRGTGATSPVRSGSDPTPPRSAAWNPRDENSPAASKPPSPHAERVLATPPRNLTLHRPHVLAPITERPSNATLRSLNAARRKASFSLPTPETPLFSSATRSSPRFPIPPRSSHRPILSLDELAALAGVSAPALSPFLPPRPAPPPRIPTPPGLPTFNSPAALSYRLPAPPQRRRDRFRPPTPKLLEWRAQTTRLPRGVVMRGEGGVLVRGRFRWGGGADVAPMSRHPWKQRTEADADADADADTDGTLGYVDRLRRSVGHGQQSNDRPTSVARGPGGDGGRSMNRNGQSGNAAAAAAAESRMRPGGNSESFWERVYNRGCWVCCGAERGEEEEEEEGEGIPSNVVVMDTVGLEGFGGVGVVAVGRSR